MFIFKQSLIGGWSLITVVSFHRFYCIFSSITCQLYPFKCLLAFPGFARMKPAAANHFNWKGTTSIPLFHDLFPIFYLTVYMLRLHFRQPICVSPSRPFLTPCLHLSFTHLSGLFSLSPPLLFIATHLLSAV